MVIITETKVIITPIIIILIIIRIASINANNVCNINKDYFSNNGNYKNDNKDNND